MSKGWLVVAPFLAACIELSCGSGGGDNQLATGVDAGADGFSGDAGGGKGDAADASGDEVDGSGDGEAGAAGLGGAPAALPLGEPSNGPRVGDQGPPAVAASESGFLVAWPTVDSFKQNALEVVRVAPDGALLDDPAIRIREPTPDASVNMVSVASDGHDYLVVWGESETPAPAGHVYGMRVSSTGLRLDASPFIVGDGTTLRFLKSVWTGARYLVVTSLGEIDPPCCQGSAVTVGADGTLGTSPLAWDTGNGYALAAAPGPDGVLVAWDGDIGVGLFTLWPDGKARTFPHEIEYGAGISALAAAWTGSAYLLLWSGPLVAGTAPSQTSGVLLEADGTPIGDGSELPFSSTCGDVAATSRGDHVVAALPTALVSIAQDGSFEQTADLSGSGYSGYSWSIAGAGDHALLACIEGAGYPTGNDVYASTLDSFDGVSNNGFQVLTRGPSVQSHVSAAADGDGFVAVWADSAGMPTAGAWSVHATEISTLGSQGPVVNIASEGGSDLAPSVASNGTQHLFAWLDHPVDASGTEAVHARRFDREGMALDDGYMVEWTPESNNVETAVAWNGQHWLVAIRDGEVVWAMRFLEDGTPVDTTNMSSNAASGLKATAWEGGFALTWQTRKVGIAVQRLASDGSVSAALWTATGSQPAIAAIDGGLAIAWHGWDDNGGIYYARLGPDLETQVSRVKLVDDPFAYYPAMVGDGSNVVLGWVTGGTHNCDGQVCALVAARVVGETLTPEVVLDDSVSYDLSMARNSDGSIIVASHHLEPPTPLRAQVQILLQ